MMDLICNFVKCYEGVASGDDILNYMETLGYSEHQASGAIGIAVKLKLIKIVKTIYIGGRKVNFFV